MNYVLMWARADGDRRRCDSACYDAKGPVCVCICGGMNHGKGLAGARKAMEDNSRSLLLDQEAGRLKIISLQGRLFSEEED